MKQKKDIKKVLIIGSGPIIIGQACEFDYSGTQACKALRKLGYEIVLVNSNPATIMTDPEIADATYIEPLNINRLEQIIAKERPDALLPNLGGQSGLNLCSELSKAGILDKYNVEVIGVQVDAIERGEDRIEFKKTMDSLGIEMARSEVAYSVDEALAIADKLGYPVVLRPAYTMGGTGGGLVYNVDELKTVCTRGLQASLVGQVLVEESILGWEELELEVVRDAEGNMITVCFIENIDPLGVHTGDSFCSAPMLTISEEVQKRLQEKSYKIVDSVQVIGGTNVQWAHDPETDRDIIIEINPRTSRSSALASKATGFPIALVSAMLATGLTLKDIPCGKYGTLDKYVPDGDYVVIKFARWAFEKFKGVEDKLGTQMRAVGEVMSIGKNYKEAFQKAIRSLETGRYGLGHAKDFDKKSKEELLKMLVSPSSERHFIMYEALRKGATVEEIHELTKVKAWFINQMKELVEEEEVLLANKGKLPADDVLIAAKKDGFSDKYLSRLLEIEEAEIRNKRIALGLEEAWEPGAGQATYRYTWSFNPDGSEGVVFWYEKIHARQGYRWTHPVHEVLSWVGEGKPGPMVVADGVQLDHHPDPTKSRGQYLPLLELSVAEDPEDDRNAHYLGREYMFHGRWDDCIATLKRHLAMPKAVWRDERAASMRYIAKSYAQKGKGRLARDWYLRAIAEAPHLREPYMDLAMLLYEQEQWEGVLYFTGCALEILKRPRTYICEAAPWGSLPHDLRAQRARQRLRALA